MKEDRSGCRSLPFATLPGQAPAADGDVRAVRDYECDHCGRTFEGVPGGAGLLLWTRGEEVRYEEPPLCEDCASQITLGALLKWDVEEEEEG